MNARNVTRHGKWLNTLQMCCSTSPVPLTKTWKLYLRFGHVNLEYFVFCSLVPYSYVLVIVFSVAARNNGYAEHQGEVQCLYCMTAIQYMCWFDSIDTIAHNIQLICS